jgi:hypothetical protein
MRRKFHIPLMILAFSSCAVLYTNCSSQSFYGGTKIQETNTGNPMESVTLSVSAFTSSTVTSLKLCPVQASLIPADGTLPAFQVNLTPGEVSAGSSEIAFATVTVPKQDYQGLELTTQKSGACGASLQVTNSNGTFSANDTSVVKFSGNFSVSTGLRDVKLGLQPIVNGLAGVASAAEVDSSLAATSGQVVSTNGIAFVQLSETTTNGMGATISTPAFTTPVTSGNLMICAIFFNGGAEQVASMGDTLGNTYWRATLSGGGGALSGWIMETWATPFPMIGGPNNIVTANFSAGFNGEKTISCHEYAGLAATNAFDNVSSTPPAFSADATIGWLTSTFPNELIFTAAAFANTGASVGPGETQRSSIGRIIISDKVVNVIGAYGTTFSNPPMDWTANLLLIKGKY